MYLLWIVRSNDFDLLDAFLVKSLYNEFIVTKENRSSFLRKVARNLQEKACKRFGITAIFIK